MIFKPLQEPRQLSLSYLNRTSIVKFDHILMCIVDKKTKKDYGKIGKKVKAVWKCLERWFEDEKWMPKYTIHRKKEEFAAE